VGDREGEDVVTVGALKARKIRSHTFLSSLSKRRQDVRDDHR
jgi:hypothetical protein